jgi:hypothetical protein
MLLFSGPALFHHRLTDEIILQIALDAEMQNRWPSRIASKLEGVAGC